MTQVITLAGKRTGYSVEQVKDMTMTVGDLISALQEYDEDTLIVISNDNGYTFGEIDHNSIDELDLDSENN